MIFPVGLQKSVLKNFNTLFAFKIIIKSNKNHIFVMNYKNYNNSESIKYKSIFIIEYSIEQH